MPTKSDRRRFFQHVLQEAVVSCDEARGVQHFKIKDLPDLPKERLERLVPKVVDELNLKVKKRRLLSFDPKTGIVKEVCAADLLEKAVLSRINGKLTIREIASWLAAHYQLVPEIAYRRTRAFFLTLALQGICVPTNPLS